MNTETFKPGQRVEVKWNRHGWLPGTVEFQQDSPDVNETCLRVRVVMDNGFACHGFGYHPDCVRAAS